ncbi:unnamed protein product [Prorocentrum cordatum]|uniref:EF-hand domain-containing protein n=1 Tax=Prorocentrum cordatum TaxID=2364126 RepID=A0ABN9QCJ7_9DINO|nr:unnamed protein product [Polarella glacialis]
MGDSPRSLHPCPSAHRWPLSLAAPRSQRVDVAFRGPRILIVRPCRTGWLDSDPLWEASHRTYGMMGQRRVTLLLVCTAAVLTDGLAVDGTAASPEERLQLEAAAAADASTAAHGLDHGVGQVSDAKKQVGALKPELPIITSAPGDTQRVGRPLPASAQVPVRRAAGMVQIFVLCVCMYGGISLMWALFWRLPEEHAFKAHGRVFLLCMTWASMSVGMQVLNKTLVSKLQAPALISVGQMWIAVVLVGIPSYKEVLDAPKGQLLIWLIVPMFFAAMLCTSCYTYQYMSLSFYTVIRNMTPLIVLPVERTLMPADKRPRLSYMVLISMSLMLCGTLMYGEGIGHVSVIGCVFAFTNMLLAVSDRLIQRRLLTTECTGLASSVCTVTNNALGSVPALLLAGATHQISDMASPEKRASWTDLRVLTLLALSGAIGIGICYLGFECQRAITATSFFVLQNFSKVVVVVCGITFFGDPISSPLAVAGLVLSIGGSFCYGKAQMSLQEQAAKQKTLGTKASGGSGPHAEYQSLERSRRLLGSLNAAAERAREPRERAAAAAFVAEAGRMAEEVAAEMKKVDDAELPFLKGIEGLPLAELQESITLCDTVGESAKVAIAQAQECFRTRLAELGGFKADAARAAKEELTKLAERVTEAAELLTQFWSELEGRRRSARVQEVEEETAGLEADVNKVAEAARPFLTGEAETLAEDAIADGVRTLGELERDAQTRLSAAWLLANRATQDARAFPEMSEALVPVHTKLSALGAELAKARVAASSFDSIVAAKFVNQQVSKVLEEMEAELETARAACAPLLEKGGDEFLVAASVARLGAGLQEHMDEKGLSKEALLEQLSSETLFADFLRALPGASGREDLSFPELRRAAMFRRLDADGDGKLSAQDLVALFRQDYACLREVPVTDSFEVKKATTVAKLRPGDVVEGVGSPRLEASGALRVECRLPAGAGNGFVTVSEGPGAFLKHHTPFDAFCASAEAAVDAATKSMGTLGFQINARLGELPRAAPPGAKGAERRDARLAELRASCTAQAQRAGAAQAGVLALRKALAAERASFARKQAAEDAVHDLARERREAAAVLGPAAERARAVQAALRALRDAAEPLGKAEGEALEASTAPAEVLQEATRLVTALAAAVAAARRALAEEVGRLAGATSGPRLEARETLATYLGDADAADRAGQQVFAMVRSKCAILVDACWSAGGAALRALRDPEQLFEELASSDGRIPEEAFCKQLGSLEDAPVRPEHARLLCSWLGQGGVSRFAFLKFAQRFYRVRKDSVLSEELHIGSSRMVRRLEVDELLLQLGASATDEKAGVERIHARALRDGAMGWVTLTGNKGSPYLEEAEKPAYLCTADMLLDADGGDAGPKVTRTLRAGEVVELLDGPREPGLRCRGRPLGGGAVGWFTLGAATAPWKPVYRCLRATPLLKQAAAEEAEPIRSLAEGETLELLDGPRACEGGAVRMLGRALRDGAVGWAAVREAGGLKALASLAERSAASSCMASSKAASLASLEVPLAAFSKAPAEGPPAAFSKATAEGPPAAFSRGPAEGPPTLSKAAAVEGPPTLSKAAAAEGPPAAFCKAAPDRPAFSKAGLAAPPAGPRPG